MTQTTVRLPERRKRHGPTTPDELLQQLPARIALDRMPTPIIGFGNAGVTVYVNPACAAMLGYADAAEVLRRSLNTLLVGHAACTPEHCVAMLQEAGGRVIDWSHAEGFSIHTMVSSALLLRATDPISMFSLSDVTELLWAEASRSRRS